MNGQNRAPVFHCLPNHKQVAGGCEASQARVHSRSKGPCDLWGYFFAKFQDFRSIELLASKCVFLYGYLHKLVLVE